MTMRILRKLPWYVKWRLRLLIPDRIYLKSKYKRRFGKRLNLKNPRTFDEKLQWLKLYDRNPLYTTLADKYAVREYIKEKIGEEYLIPLVGGPWSSADDIDFDSLPEQFVLKCTHDSGSIEICRNKDEFNTVSARKNLNKALKTNYFAFSREWPYKNIKRQIIAEKYMTDESGTQLKDYKIYNFNGEPQIIQVDYNRFTNYMRNLYTTQWDYIDAQIQYPSNPDYVIKKPEALNGMLAAAKRLSENIPFIRSDFYCIDDQIYFGELTFYPEGGFGRFIPEQLGIEMGEWMEIPNKYSGGGGRIYPEPCQVCAVAA